jgi:hypothetical protein
MAGGKIRMCNFGIRKKEYEANIRGVTVFIIHVQNTGTTGVLYLYPVGRPETILRQNE